MEHGSCGLIDMRLGAGDLTGMLNLRPVHTVAHFCESLQRVDRSMFDQMFARHASGVELLAAPLDAGLSRHITAKGIRQLLAMSRQKFPYVVVDLDNTYAEEQLETLWQSDIVLIVLRLDYTSLRNTRRLLDRLADLGISEERLRLVVNRYRQPKELRVAQAEEALGKKVFHFIPDDPRHVHAALNQGTPLVQYAPRSSVSRSLMNLAAQVNGRHVSH